MQDQQIIDHLLFRKLFAETFAPFTIDGFAGRGGDDYVIEPSGVRWKQTEDDFIQGVGRALGPTDETTITMLEIIQRAKLPFPCSPMQALAWADRNRDTGSVGDGPNGFIYVPDWLVEALGQRDADAASSILSAATDELDAEIAASQADGDHDKARHARHERANLALAVEAFTEIRRLLAPPVMDNMSRTKRISAAEANKSKLLLAIVDAGLNASSLPQNPRGKPGAKSQVARFALKRGLTKAQFRKAWEAAFLDSTIKYME